MKNHTGTQYNAVLEILEPDFHITFIVFHKTFENNLTKITQFAFNVISAKENYMLVANRTENFCLKFQASIFVYS